MGILISWLQKAAELDLHYFFHRVYIWFYFDFNPLYSGKPLNAGMRKFRIDQDFLIEHWHMVYIMSVVFAEIYV